MKKSRQKQRHNKLGDQIFIGFCYCFVFIFALMIVIPFWTVLMDSISDSNIKGGIRMWPDGFTLKAYKSVLSQKTLVTNYGNTIYRTVLGTVLCLVVTYFAAYPLSKKKLPFNRLITYLVLFTMYFSGGLIPPISAFSNSLILLTTG